MTTPEAERTTLMRQYNRVDVLLRELEHEYFVDMAPMEQVQDRAVELVQERERLRQELRDRGVRI